MKTLHPDHPIEDVARTAMEHISKGHTIFQKFTCAGCGARQTMTEPNKLFTSGICEECGYETNIQARGCNYMLVAGNTRGLLNVKG